MRDRPIIFSGPMVRAILEGRKTQTRRVIKGCVERGGEYTHERHEQGWFPRCPYGVPGDRLWVRETWRLIAWDGDVKTVGIDYPADGDSGCTNYVNRDDHLAIARRLLSRKKRPSIHMPRWVSRITLEVAGVRVERVQEIAEADAIAEGIDVENVWGIGNAAPDPDGGYTDPVTAFHKLWDSINAKRGYSWESNPFVWVVEFKVVKP